MSFLNNLSVKVKMLLGFFSVLIIFLVVSLISIIYINGTNTTIERVNHVVANRMDAITDLQNHVMEGDFIFAEILTAFQDTPAARQRYVKLLDTQTEAIETTQAKIEIYGVNANALRNVVNQATAWANVYHNQMRDALLNGSFEKISEIYGQGLSAPYKELANQCNKLLELYRDEVIERTTIIAQDNSLYYIILGTIFATIFSVLIALTFASLIVKRLNYCIEHANTMAKGDFSKKINSDSEDEFGLMMTAFSRMQANLNHTISTIINKTNQVVKQVKNIQNLNHTIAADISMNDTNAVTVATAVTEMVSTTGNIAQSCEGAAASSDHSRQSTDQGMESIKHAIERVKLQSERTNEDAKNLEDLSAQTQKIGFIVNTIDDIANQTNLLALNAAIEAARAGEVGRGFAVVADEVRALASRTTNSTSEIKSMVQSIQDSAKLSVESMSKTVENIGELASSADLLETVFDDVIANVNQVNTQVTQIAAAAEEQTTATSEISKNIQHISDSSHKIADLTEKGLQQLDNMANNLVDIQESMRFFKISSNMSDSFRNAESNVYPVGVSARSFAPNSATPNYTQGQQGTPAFVSAQER